MPQAISDVRVARSFIGANAVNVTESVELDFGLGTQEAIEIIGIIGLMNMVGPAEPVVTTQEVGQQTLHIEEQALEVASFAPASPDFFESDSEIIYQQTVNHHIVVDSANGHAGMTTFINPSGMVTLPEPVISPINLTHRVITLGTLQPLGANLSIWYRYVRLTTAELGLQFARRRR